MASFFSWISGKPPVSAAQRAAEASFTQQELKAIQQHFRDVLAHQTAAARRPASSSSSAAGPGLDSSGLAALVGAAAWACLEPALAGALLRAVADPRDGAVRLEGLLTFKASLERQGEEAAHEATFRLLDTHGDGRIRQEALAAAITSAVRLALAAAAGNGGGGGGAPSAVSAEHVGAVCRGALMSESDSYGSGGGGGNGTSGGLSYEGYRRWCKRCPALHAALSRLLANVGEGTSGGGGGVAALGPPLPALVQLGKLAAGAALLQPVWAWLLGARLPPAQRQEWRLLFSSQRDGKSFQTLLGRLAASPGPTLLLLRERGEGAGGGAGAGAGGALMGGYGPAAWARSGAFFGDVSAFIFGLEPAAQVFPATGINDHYQWCGAGFSQLPGGLGWGGDAGGRGAFALYVEPSLEAGMSRPIATYGNVPLAAGGEQVFQLAALECWLLQPPEEEPGGGGGASSHGGASAPGSNGGGNGGGRAGGGVLSRNAEDRAIMELAGFKLHSAGLREEPLEE